MNTALQYYAMHMASTKLKESNYRCTHVMLKLEGNPTFVLRPRSADLHWHCQHIIDQD